MTTRRLLLIVAALALPALTACDPTPTVQASLLSPTTSTTSTTQAPPPPPPDHCTDYNNMEHGTGEVHNQDWFNHLDPKGYARVRLACVYHGGTQQWYDLDWLWNHENDGGDTGTWHRTNIPQAKPFSKMGCSTTDHRCQVRWGLDYIASRYGNPSAAKSAWLSRSPHWY